MIVGSVVWPVLLFCAWSEWSEERSPVPAVDVPSMLIVNVHERHLFYHLWAVWVHKLHSEEHGGVGVLVGPRDVLDLVSFVIHLKVQRTEVTGGVIGRYHREWG